MSEEPPKKNGFEAPGWMKRTGGRIRTVGKVLFFGYIAVQVGAFTLFATQRYAKKKMLEYIHDDTILRWKFDDVRILGERSAKRSQVHITEAKKESDSLLDALTKKQKTMTFHEMLRALDLASKDPRIKGAPRLWLQFIDFYRNDY